MLGHPSSENDIRARAAVLAEAILSTNPYSDVFLRVRNEFKSELAQITLPAEQMTFFAMERVAARAGIQAVWLEGPLVSVPNGARTDARQWYGAPTRTRIVRGGARQLEAGAGRREDCGAGDR